MVQVVAAFSPFACHTVTLADTSSNTSRSHGWLHFAGLSLQTTASVTETLEVSLLYIRFRTQLNHVQPLMALIHKRADRRRCVVLDPVHWFPMANHTHHRHTHTHISALCVSPCTLFLSIADTALDCYASYLDHRRAVVSQVVLAKLESLKTGKDTLALVGVKRGLLVRHSPATPGTSGFF